MIALDTLGGGAPKWARFLELSEEEKKRVFNHTAFGLVFVQAAGRWFAVSFGMGHVKLDPAAFEQDFGLRVVLNAVDPKQLKSADIRTPDENTLSRRTQTSRGSDQTAFAFDIEGDLVRRRAGTSKDAGFGSYVAGTHGLTLNRKLCITTLPQACSDAFTIYQCQRRLKIRPKGGAKDCHVGWWSDLGVRLGVGDAVRGFFGGSGQRSHAELKRSAPAGRPQGGMVYRVGVGLATRASGARCRPGPIGCVPQFSYRHCFCGRGFG